MCKSDAFTAFAAALFVFGSVSSGIVAEVVEVERICCNDPAFIAGHDDPADAGGDEIAGLHEVFEILTAVTGIGDRLGKEFAVAERDAPFQGIIRVIEILFIEEDLSDSDDIAFSGAGICACKAAVFACHIRHVDPADHIGAASAGSGMQEAVSGEPDGFRTGLRKHTEQICTSEVRKPMIQLIIVSDDRIPHCSVILDEDIGDFGYIFVIGDIGQGIGLHQGTERDAGIQSRFELIFGQGGGIADSGDLKHAMIVLTDTNGILHDPVHEADLIEFEYDSAGDGHIRICKHVDAERTESLIALPDEGEPQAVVQHILLLIVREQDTVEVQCFTTPISVSEREASGSCCAVLQESAVRRICEKRICSKSKSNGV